MKKIKTLVLPFLSLLLLLNLNLSAAVVPTSEDPTAKKIADAVKEFKSLPRAERKAKIKEAKKIWKEYQADKKAGRSKDDDNHILAIIFAILLPPVGVLIYEGKVTTKFWIALLLTLLFWLPGAIYALLVVTGNA